MLLLPVVCNVVRSAKQFHLQCTQPVVAHWRGSVVLRRLCNDKLKRQGESRSALERSASGALEEEETHVHSSLPSTRAGQQNSRDTVVG